MSVILNEYLSQAHTAFRRKKNYETAAEFARWLMLAVAEDYWPLSSTRVVAGEILTWLEIESQKLPGIYANSPRLELARSDFRQRPSTHNAARYLKWLLAIQPSVSKEEVLTGLFELHHWLVQASRPTDIYFQK